MPDAIISNNTMLNAHNSYTTMPDTHNRYWQHFNHMDMWLMERVEEMVLAIVLIGVLLPLLILKEDCWY